MNLILKQYKDDTGNINFKPVLSIPVTERLPQIAKRDFLFATKLVGAAITIAFEHLGAKKGANEGLIWDIADAIMDSCSEDNLAFEDLMLFLQKLTRGEYDVSVENMSVPKFMKIFEIYREERWQKLNQIRHEEHSQLKFVGSTSRNTKEDPLCEHFASLGAKLSEMKTQIGNLKEENKNLKMDNL